MAYRPDWLHSGVPSGVTLEDCEGDPVNELLKKRESIKDAVERLRSANGRKHWRSGAAETASAIMSKQAADIAADVEDSSGPVPKPVPK